MEDNFIFVVGCPRSGTTFLARTLASHPDIALCSETHYFSGIFHDGAIKKTKHLFPVDTDEKVDELFKLLTSEEIYGSFWTEPERIDYEKVKMDFKRTERTHKDLFALIMREWALKKDAQIGGDKTPTHVFHVDELLTWYPNAHVIHILRDPRAVLASQINRPRIHRGWLKTRSSIGQFFIFPVVLGEWWLATRKHLDYQTKYPNRYKLIQYEEIVVNHEDITKQLCQFLDVPFNPHMLDLPILRSSFQDRDRYNVLDGWRAHLPKVYDYLMRLVLRKQMRKYGYTNAA